MNKKVVTNSNNKSVFVISAHADDNMACAGTLLKLNDRGFEIYEAVLTDSGEGRSVKDPNIIDVVEIRNNELNAVSKELGIKETFVLNQPDLGLSYSKELMLKLAGLIRKVKPSIGFVMNTYDWHPDHRESSKIGTEAFKWAGTGVRPELGDAYRTPIVLCSEGMIPTQATILVDVTKFSDRKLALWNLYESQASSKAINFDKSLLSVRGYQLRRKESLMAEAFTIDPTNPVILFDD
jgi:LmbE family N-acetylglucosaminyl deacetylase